MMSKIIKLSALLAIASLAACASIPTGPNMMALPGSGRSFDEFRYDDYYCRQFAYEQVGGMTPNRASITSGVGSAAVGAGLGAAGAALRLVPAPVFWGEVWREQALPMHPAMAASNVTIQDIPNACTAKVIVFRYPVRSTIPP